MLEFDGGSHQVVMAIRKSNRILPIDHTMRQLLRESKDGQFGVAQPSYLMSEARKSD